MDSCLSVTLKSTTASGFTAHTQPLTLIIGEKTPQINELRKKKPSAMCVCVWCVCDPTSLLLWSQRQCYADDGQTHTKVRQRPSAPLTTPQYPPTHPPTRPGKTPDTAARGNSALCYLGCWFFVNEFIFPCFVDIYLLFMTINLIERHFKSYLPVFLF